MLCSTMNSGEETDSDIYLDAVDSKGSGNNITNGSLAGNEELCIFRSMECLANDARISDNPFELGVYKQVIEARVVLNRNRGCENHCRHPDKRNEKMQKVEETILTCQIPNMHKHGMFCTRCGDFSAECKCQLLKESPNSYCKQKDAVKSHCHQPLQKCSCKTYQRHDRANLKSKDDNSTLISLLREMNKLQPNIPDMKQTRTVCKIPLRCTCTTSMRGIKRNYNYTRKTPNIFDKEFLPTFNRGNKLSETLKKKLCTNCKKSDEQCVCGAMKSINQKDAVCQYCGLAGPYCRCHKLKAFLKDTDSVSVIVLSKNPISNQLECVCNSIKKQEHQRESLMGTIEGIAIEQKQTPKYSEKGELRTFQRTNESETRDNKLKQIKTKNDTTLNSKSIHHQNDREIMKSEKVNVQSNVNDKSMNNPIVKYETQKEDRKGSSGSGRRREKSIPVGMKMKSFKNSRKSNTLSGTPITKKYYIPENVMKNSGIKKSEDMDLEVRRDDNLFNTSNEKYKTPNEKENFAPQTANPSASNSKHPGSSRRTNSLKPKHIDSTSKTNGNKLKGSIDQEGDKLEPLKEEELEEFEDKRPLENIRPHKADIDDKFIEHEEEPKHIDSTSKTNGNKVKGSIDQEGDKLEHLKEEELEEFEDKRPLENIRPHEEDIDDKFIEHEEKLMTIINDENTSNTHIRKGIEEIKVKEKLNDEKSEANIPLSTSETKPGNAHLIDNSSREGKHDGSGENLIEEKNRASGEKDRKKINKDYRIAGELQNALDLSKEIMDNSNINLKETFPVSFKSCVPVLDNARESRTNMNANEYSVEKSNYEGFHETEEEDHFEDAQPLIELEEKIGQPSIGIEKNEDIRKDTEEPSFIRPISGTLRKCLPCVSRSQSCSTKIPSCIFLRSKDDSTKFTKLCQCCNKGTTTMKIETKTTVQQWEEEDIRKRFICARCKAIRENKLIYSNLTKSVLNKTGCMRPTEITKHKPINQGFNGTRKTRCLESCRRPGTTGQISDRKNEDLKPNLMVSSRNSLPNSITCIPCKHIQNGNHMITTETNLKKLGDTITTKCGISRTITQQFFPKSACCSKTENKKIETDKVCPYCVSTNTSDKSLVHREQQCIIKDCNKDQSNFTKCNQSQTGGTTEQDVIASFVASCTSTENNLPQQKFVTQTLLYQFPGYDCFGEEPPQNRHKIRNTEYSLEQKSPMQSTQIQVGKSRGDTKTTYVLTDPYIGESTPITTSGAVNYVCGPDVQGIRTRIGMNLNQIPSVEDVSALKNEDGASSRKLGDCVSSVCSYFQNSCYDQSVDKVEYDKKQSQNTENNKCITITVTPVQTDPFEANYYIIVNGQKCEEGNKYEKTKIGDLVNRKPNCQIVKEIEKGNNEESIKSRKISDKQDRSKNQIFSLETLKSTEILELVKNISNEAYSSKEETVPKTLDNDCKYIERATSPCEIPSEKEKEEVACGSDTCMHSTTNKNEKTKTMACGSDKCIYQEVYDKENFEDSNVVFDTCRSKMVENKEKVSKISTKCGPNTCFLRKTVNKPSQYDKNGCSFTQTEGFSNDRIKIENTPKTIMITIGCDGINVKTVEGAIKNPPVEICEGTNYQNTSEKGDVNHEKGYCDRAICKNTCEIGVGNSEKCFLDAGINTSKTYNVMDNESSGAVLNICNPFCNAELCGIELIANLCDPFFDQEQCEPEDPVETVEGSVNDENIQEKCDDTRSLEKNNFDQIIPSSMKDENVFETCDDKICIEKSLTIPKHVISNQVAPEVGEFKSDECNDEICINRQVTTKLNPDDFVALERAVDRYIKTTVSSIDDD